jgi:phosphoglycerate dehydrogenase-like enzyme
MTELRIFNDTAFGEKTMAILRDGVAGHVLVAAQKPAASVLGKSEAGPEIESVEIAFGQPDVADVLRATKLRWLHLTSAGYTRYDTADFRAAMKHRGVVVTNSSSVYAEACVEHVMAFLLAQARLLPQNLVTRCANGASEWHALREGSRLLIGQRVLIAGYGAIAARLVEVLAPFRMNVVAMRRNPRGNEPIRIVRMEDFDAELVAADHVINILPDNAQSRGYFNVRRFAQMKQDAAFYNIGRGTTVNQEALADALEAGHLAAAWLDVTDPEPLPHGHRLLSAPRCFITPHTAGGHTDEAGALVRHFLDNLQRFAAGQPLMNRILE